MRLIDADALMVKNHENVAVAHNERAAQLLENIMNAPTIEARPVVRGEWVLKERAHYFKCSLCKEPIPYKFGYADSRRYYNFCPECGADMRTKEEDNG